MIHPHLFFEAAAYLVSALIYLRLRRRFGDPIVTPLRWAALAAAVAGATLGSKILFWMEDPRLTLQSLNNPVYLAGGKTIVGALIFGLIAVELMKRYIGLQTSTGDLYALPLAIGIAIGRVGCFLTGISDNTYGTPTTLPWGVDFGDGIRRHPTQLYEIAFLVLLTPVLYRALYTIVNGTGLVILNEAATEQSEVAAQSQDPYPQTNLSSAELPTSESPKTASERFLPGDAFKLFMVAYMTFRFFCDFIKPYPRLFLGLGAIQWACVFVLLYYSSDIRRWLRTA